VDARYKCGHDARELAALVRHFKSLRMILPTLLFGSESTNTITFGTL
jgi:hypothetical protein